MQEYITNARTKTVKEFTDFYNFPFLIQITEPDSGDQSANIHHETVVAQVDAAIKANSSKMAIKNIIPILKNKKNIIKDMIIVGRDRIQDIVINNKKISKSHAYFKIKDHLTYLLFDPGSTNGTFLNGERIHHSKPYEIKNNDVISFADFSFRFYLPESAYYTIRIFGKK